MLTVRRIGLLVTLSAAACATPQEVKRATVALDDGYRSNLETMQKYRDTADALNRLQHNWARYIKVRALLSLAVDWATLEPPPSESDQAMAAISAQLGEDILAWVNRNRLAGLRRRDPLVAGTAKLDQLVQELPLLAILVTKKAEADLAANSQLRSLAPYEDYSKRVAILRSANAAVRNYLAVDVTVTKDEVNDIADSIKKLRGAK